MASGSDIFGKIKPPAGLEEFNSSNPNAAISNLLGISIKLFFIVAGLVALLFLLRGSLDWIMSSGEKEKISAAQQRIQNAIIGLILIIIVVSIVAVLEQIVFAKHFCFGLTCGIKLPQFGN